MENTENAKERFKNGRKMIEERRLLPPFPPNTFERFQANEVWEIVLEFFTDALDICTVYYACTTFQQMLVERFLTEISRVLKKNDFLVDGREFLSARPVSKLWKTVTEKVFMDEFSDHSWHLNFLNGWHPSPGIRRTSVPQCLIPYYPSGTTCHYNDASIPRPNIPHFYHPRYFNQRMMKLMEESSSHVALLQVIHINEHKCPEHLIRLFSKKYIEFLGKHGDFVQGLILNICGRYCEDRYRVLLTVLERVRHLKALIIRCDDYIIYPDHFERVSEYFPEHTSISIISTIG